MVEDKASGSLGILTNKHVALDPGNILYHPDPLTTKLATTERTAEFVADEDRFDGLIDEMNARFRVDCAFAKLESTISRDYLDPTVPVLPADAASIERKAIGATFELDLDTMGPLGMRVFGVGRTRSFQRGTIVAFAYEHLDAADEARYTDYLIIGDEPDEFSDPGDSGKLIFTDEEVPRPVALLWGGWYEKLRPGKDQENWTYAIDINYVLKTLNLEIVSTLA